MTKRDLLGSGSIQAGLRILGASMPPPLPKLKTLRRRPDGTLTFMNGAPVKRHELLPGETYTVINDPPTPAKP